MPFEWPVDPHEVFGERYPQMLNRGLPADDVDRVRAAITDMWPDRPGGWVHEWSRLGARYAGAGQHGLAAQAYGWAKFPTLANAAKRAALAHQLAQYQLAVPSSGVDVERRILDLPHRGGRTDVAVHLISPPGQDADAPVLIASGGVDTWKMDIHPVLVLFARHAAVRVLAFDIAGTGETAVPMTPDGGAEIVEGLVAAARELGNGTVAHLGISMGGYFSARAGLAGLVDAAIVLGGPVEQAFGGLSGARFGMDGIVGNALGFDRPPVEAELAARLAPFSLRPLLDEDRNAPMLVVNGADDVHVPAHDTLVFRGRRDTVVELLPGTGHCAVSRSREVYPMMIGWLNGVLGSS